MKVATDVLIFASAGAGYAFLLRFALTTWFRTVVGRIVMATAAALTIIFTLAVLSTTLGQDYPGRETVRFIGYLLTTLVLWWAAAVLWLDQMRVRRRERNARGE